MITLKRHGFNLIKLQEHWAVDQPREDVYDFSRYEELIAHAATLDLGVYLGLTCEQAPNWLWRKYPDCRMVGRNGLPIAYQAQSTLPADGKPGPCFDHPGARAAQERFLRQLVAVLGRFDNLVIWNTWQEIAYWADGLTGQTVCYCPHTLAAFRLWLAERFGDLDGLNRAWNTRYLDWDDVEPDRLVHGRGGLPQQSAWNYFMDNVHPANTLRDRARIICDADPLHRPVFAHKGGPIIGAGTDWTYARCQDFLGASCYPAWTPVQSWDDTAQGPRARHASLLAEAQFVALQYDYIRSANRPGAPLWAAEFQGGPISSGFARGRVPSAEDIRRWTLTAAGSGITALSFWVTRAEIMPAEDNGFSLLDSDGDETPRLREAARIGALFNRYPALFAQPTRPAAKVGIVVSEWNYQVCQTLDRAGDHLAYAVRGWHRLLWEMGIPVDFVEIDHFEHAQEYAVLIFPVPLALSEDAAERLHAYVHAGGHLFCEAMAGRYTEESRCNRGELSPTLRGLFGVRHAGLTLVREPDAGTRWSPPERTWGDFIAPAMLDGVGSCAGLRLRANLYLETFLPDGGDPSFTHGDAVAGVTRQIGCGRAWLFGTFLGHNGAAYRDDETRTALRALLAQCGVTPDHPGRLLRQRRVTPKAEAWLFTNPTDEAITETIDVAGWPDVIDPLEGPIIRYGDQIELTVAPLDIRILIVAWSA